MSGPTSAAELVPHIPTGSCNRKTWCLSDHGPEWPQQCQGGGQRSTPAASWASTVPRSFRPRLRPNEALQSGTVLLTRLSLLLSLLL